MTIVEENPKWVRDIVNIDFSIDYPTDRESGPGPLQKQFKKDFTSWMKRFCNHIGATNFELYNGYSEYSGFFKVGEQLWYFNTEDIRYKIMGGMLIRTAEHNKDWRGGRNQFVIYDNNFATNLRNIVGG